MNETTITIGGLVLIGVVIFVWQYLRLRSIKGALEASSGALVRLMQQIQEVAAQAPTEVYPLPKELPKILEAVTPFVKTAMGFDETSSGAYKRDWVFRNFTKQNPDVSETALHHAIGFAFKQEKEK